MKVVSKKQALLHYDWGEGCHGWNLVAEPTLSVKQELMPPQSAELKHWHRYAQQFFFVLKGKALFEVDGERFELRAAEGIHIPAGKIHCISNLEDEDLEFLLCSQPTTQADRVNQP